MQALLDAIAAMPLPVDACRIFHGRGGLYPGCEQWTLDAYPPVFVLTSFAPATDEQLATIGAALQARWQHIAPPGQALNWVFQQRGEALRLQARSDTRLMAGCVPDPHIVTEGPARFLVHVLRRQNHGLFLDMAEGRRWVREFAADFLQREGRGAKVLNLFAYTCAFSVAALQGGAAHVTNLDMARGALATGQQNHQLNGLTHGASFLAHDLFNSWGKLTRGGPYDLVIADPPSYQKGSFVATKDYARLLRRLPGLLAPGGHALLCLNAPELSMAWLQDQAREHAPELAFVEHMANPAVFADVGEGRGLKVGAYQLSRQKNQNP
ncbi:MAG: class I SAM-dependent methyltransferase [Burkholderiales bacterium]|nr:class I SAM-dependent methyltransferase [Burkholderiales bacterium]MBK8665594.1 class I SAM-dependent methyltransferase [Burkholderiales bacterium]